MQDAVAGNILYDMLIMCSLVLMYYDNQGWILSLSVPPRSCSAMRPGRGSRRLVFKVLRSGSQWCCATRCPTPRTLPLHRWCHKGLLSCSTAIPTPRTPQKVGRKLESVVLSCRLCSPSFSQHPNGAVSCCFSRAGGCRTVSRAHVPSSA